MSVQVKEIVTVEVRTSDGQVLKKGDPILIRIKKEDIVCQYIGIENGYFVTQTLEDGIENKYRQGSIEVCYKIRPVERIVDTLKEAAAEAAQEAAQPVLAAATE